MAPQPLLAAEVEKHPEYPHVIWKLQPTKKEHLEVGQGRGGPYKIDYEVHGTGPKKIIFIMGLGGLKSNWQRQTKDLGHTRGSEYSVLLMDNIGIGESDKPVFRYSTSNMARDVLQILDRVGWTGERSLLVCGISMGGMIAQELAVMIPERIGALMLISTAARLVNTVGFFENLRSRVNLFLPKSIDEQIANAKHNIYTDEYLVSPDKLEYTVQPFPTSGDRFAAAELTKRRNPEMFNKWTFMCQAVAAGWHHKSHQQLTELADKIGRERICVMHGTADRMITVPHGYTLLEELSQGGKDGEMVRAEIVEGQGHVIPIERREWFNGVVMEMAKFCKS